MIDKTPDQNQRCCNTNVIFDSEEERMILATAIEQSSVAILMTDIHGDIIYVNPAFEKISGYKTAEVIGKNPRLLKSGLTDPKIYEKMWETISNGGIWNGEQINKRKDGSLYYEDSRITPIYNKDNKLTYYMAVKHDITERKILEEKLKEISIRDPLTNAFNRRYLLERLNQIGDNYKRVGSPFSVAILDIDLFKEINDTYGHQAGDHMLVEFVGIINKNIRSYDILGRYGGEEFVLVLPDTNKENAFNLVNRILEKTRDTRFTYDSYNIEFKFSAGISDSSEIGMDGFKVEDLIGIADNRLYEAKKTGRGRIVI